MQNRRSLWHGRRFVGLVLRYYALRERQFVPLECISHSIHSQELFAFVSCVAIECLEERNFASHITVCDNHSTMMERECSQHECHVFTISHHSMRSLHYCTLRHITAQTFPIWIAPRRKNLKSPALISPVSILDFKMQIKVQQKMQKCRCLVGTVGTASLGRGRRLPSVGCREG
jgi:hypothetical protein